MHKLLLIIFIIFSNSFFAQDSIVFNRKVVTGKIIDYSPAGVLIRDNQGEIKYYIYFYKRLTFSDTLAVYSRYPSQFKKRVVIDTVFLKNGNTRLFTKLHLKGTRGIINDDELMFSYPISGSDFFVVKKADILRITDNRNRISSNAKTKFTVSNNDTNKRHIVFLNSGVVFKTDFCYFKRRKLFFEDDFIAPKLSIPKNEIEKVIFSDSIISYIDTVNTNKHKVHPPARYIKHAEFYPYWTKKNYAGINLTNFLMCDLNVSYYRSLFRNTIDVGIGINIPIISTSREISNLSALNNQYYKFTKNYEWILSTEYYIFHSQFYRNLSFGLVYRHTNFNYTYVDNSSGYFKNDNYKIIENRTNRNANALFLTSGLFIPIKKRFFFKANLGVGWEEYNDPYQLQKGNELYGSSLAAYTNFMAGFKF